MTPTTPIITPELVSRLEEFAAVNEEVSLKEGTGDWEQDHKRLKLLIAGIAGLISRQEIGDELEDNRRMVRNQVIDGIVKSLTNLVIMIDNMVVASMVKERGIGKTMKKLGPSRRQS